MSFHSFGKHSRDSTPALGRVDDGFCATHKTQPGDLLRFTVSDVGYRNVDGSPEPFAGGLNFVKQCSALRALPDSWHKILFHSPSWPHHVTMQALAQSVSHVARAVPDLSPASASASASAADADDTFMMATDNLL